MKKLTDFESLDDFGFKSRVDTIGKVQYVKCDSDLEKLAGANEITADYIDGDMTTGKFFNLEDMLSGGSLSVPLSDTLNKSQAELALDYNLSSSLAFLGSVYSTVMIGINKIKSEYPNGFTVVAGNEYAVSTTAVTIEHNTTYWYGKNPSNISDYTEYELIQIDTASGLMDAKYAILSSSSGITETTLYLDGEISEFDDGLGFEIIIQPTTGTTDKFYSTLTPYELDLLVPPFDRTNYVPRDTIATNNLVLEGSGYDTFVETELDWATLADNEDANFIVRKLFPDGQFNLDSDDTIMQKMLLTIAMNFDQIKKYQDQLKYQQTIGYNTNNHVSKDLVELLASQWNWSLGHNLNQDDYSKHIYSTYDNYITGQSQQKLSAKDVNFEMWRRVLANLVSLYKKKGTREAIKVVANMYGLPEALFWIEELVQAISINGPELIASESNIVVPMSGSQYYIDSVGSAKTLPYTVVSNTKYLNINISPFDAIEYDFFDWGWESHPDITNINGISVALSSTTEPTKAEFFSSIYNNTIRSDGGARYDYNYPLLENEGALYYSTSVNKYTLSTLEPYMDFLDDNWNILMSNLVPASSRIMDIGTLYRNPMWNREKHQWNISELSARTLPFNEDIEINHVTPEVEVSTSKVGTIDIDNTSGSLDNFELSSVDQMQLTPTKSVNVATEFDAQTEIGTLTKTLGGTITSPDPSVDSISAHTDNDTMSYTYSSVTYEINSPLLEPISGQYGTASFVDYNTDSLVVTNQNKFDIVFSASNISDSGYTKLEFSLFRKLHDDATVIDDTKEYSILSVDYETPTYGAYRVSSVLNIDVNDYVSISSEYLPFINNMVQVTHIDSGSSQIRTSPSIGLLSLPTGRGNTIVDWGLFMSLGTVARLRGIFTHGPISLSDMIRVFDAMAFWKESGDVANLSRVFEILEDELELMTYVVRMFNWFIGRDVNIIYGVLLLLDFINGNPSWNLASNQVALIGAVASTQAKATFKRVINFFNWQIPEQTVEYSNISASTGGDFLFPDINVASRSEANDYNMTGTVTLGGVNDLYADVLKDKEEYFYRYKVNSHAPPSWGLVSGFRYFYPLISGGSLLDSEYDLTYYNNIKYYGRYFMFMNTPKVPIANIVGLIDGATYDTSLDASVNTKWNGVGDSDRLELQYMSAVSNTDPFATYASIGESDWVSSAITINVGAKDNVGDDYIYTVQTTLEPDTYYWWRVKNFRNKINMFGNNLEYFTSTQPKVFKTGSFSGGGQNIGEIPNDPEAPNQPRGKNKFDTD